MKVALLAREYPPEVYGGAGVHVEYLARELAGLAEVEVRCFGAARNEPGVRAYEPWERLDGVLGTLSVDLAMAGGLDEADVVHSHTWYANLGGHLGKLLHTIPHVMTTHSLEPLRPWKAEQLGAGGYAISSFCERTAIEAADAVIAVSGAMRDDVLRCYPAVRPERVAVIHNGIDPEEYAPEPNPAVLDKYGIDASRPFILFVGRIARQKGITHLLDAAAELDPSAQLVLVAAHPDTPELEREVREKVVRAIWIEAMLDRPEVIQLLTQATVFCCPSVYEPLGIVNLEAMACETAVVASAVGGIPEVVEDGVTGLLVPAGDAAALAKAINELVADPARAAAMGEAGRRLVLERFSWSAVAERTLDLYRSLV